MQTYCKVKAFLNFETNHTKIERMTQSDSREKSDVYMKLNLVNWITLFYIITQVFDGSYYHFTITLLNLQLQRAAKSKKRSLQSPSFEQSHLPFRSESFCKLPINTVQSMILWSAR